MENGSQGRKRERQDELRHHPLLRKEMDKVRSSKRSSSGELSVLIRSLSRCFVLMSSVTCIRPMPPEMDMQSEK